MITNKKPVYNEKFYCNECKNIYVIHLSSCQKCGSDKLKSFKVDERKTDLIQFNALRSMRRYNIKMGNV